MISRAIVSVTILLIIIVIAAIAGLRSVSSGVNEFEGLEHDAARDAIMRAHLACGNEPGERIIRRKWRVIDLEVKDERMVKAVPFLSPEIELVPHYRATLRSYTIFGIPTLTIEVSPTGSIVCSGV